MQQLHHQGPINTRPPASAQGPTRRFEKRASHAAAKPSADAYTPSGCCRIAAEEHRRTAAAVPRKPSLLSIIGKEILTKHKLNPKGTPLRSFGQKR
ncbi:hypothetical protein U9M48_031196 [Paspalum notatum var. saurae]|uniref:Uncharacterized protein n=1 Tax=Paspalum notatum var. saurae TaxID=547442 RepID=A0AAQ3U2A3_PASNO